MSLDKANKSLNSALATDNEGSYTAALIGMRKLLLKAGFGHHQISLIPLDTSDVEPEWTLRARVADLEGKIDQKDAQYDALWDRLIKAERERDFYKSYLHPNIWKIFRFDNKEREMAL